MMHPMRTSLFVLALAIAATATAPASFAQTPPPAAAQDHRAHHPDAAAPAKPDAPAAPQAQQSDKPPGGAMGGAMAMTCGEMNQDMKSLKGMMHDMMRMHGAMMPPPVDAALSTLKSELKLTGAQAPLWERFAEVWRIAAATMKSQHRAMMASGDGTLPARLARREAVLASHLSSVKNIEEALAPLYATLSDEQKRIVDRTIALPMGMM